jgi:hypothetical protein
MGVKMEKEKDSKIVYPIFPEEIREKSRLGKYSPRAAVVEGVQSLIDLFSKEKDSKQESSEKAPKRKNTMKKGGKVGKPRGCGTAQRGYGKAMMGGGMVKTKRGYSGGGRLY